MRRAHDVRRDRVDRRAIALADDGLRGEMEHDVGAARVPRTAQRREVADVAANVPHTLGDMADGEEIRIGRRRERIARDVGAELGQPQRQPAALEAGMPGHEDALAAIRAAEIDTHTVARSHTTHGDRPVAHISEIC